MPETKTSETGTELRAEPSTARDASALSRGASRPPPRRDPRADPDDEPVGTRVDVVSVDRAASVDSLTHAALTLRRELAKLHQQAAAVERTIEDQRRERTDTLERVETANARADDLERRLALAETEIGSVRGLHDAALEDLQKVRAERDDLARAIESAKSASEELARVRAEVDGLREAHDAAARAASTHEAELAEIRKREQTEAQKVTDGEAELGSLRERLERSAAELTQSREEAAQGKVEIARLRAEAAEAAEAATKQQAELERERTTAKEAADRLDKALAEARSATEKLAVAESDLAAARVEAAEGRTEIHRLERDLDAARHARDVSLERASMAEREAADARTEVERHKRELDGAAAAAGAAAARAAAAERAKSGVEDSVRQLRDEITTAFARWRSATPSSPPPAGTLPPPTRANLGAALDAREQAPPTRRGTTSFPPLTAEARPLSMPAPPAVDDGWTDSPLPDGAASATPPSPDAGASRSSAAPPRSAPLPTPSRPPVPPPARRASQPSIPPAVYPSLPPPAGLTPSSLPGPPSSAVVVSQARDDLLEELLRPATAATAAARLRERPDWLRGRPPVELLLALTHLDYDVEAPAFEVARAWEREPICRALIAALRDEPDVRLREHGAWLLKHLGSPTAWPALAELASHEAEPSSVRRWLLEAIERLVASRSIGWPEVGDLVHLLLRHADSSLRDGAVGVVSALERSDDKRRVLLDLLRSEDDEMVLSSAVHALTTALPIDLDPSLAERLLGHSSPRVQRSVVDFIERSKRAAAQD